MISRLALWSVAATLMVSSCGKDEGTSDSTGTEETPTVGDGGKQPDGSGSGSGTGTGTGTVADVGLACGALADGATEQRTRYRAASVVAGLAACESETQTVTCADGVLSHTGSFTETACVKQNASLSAGDILVLREDGGDHAGDAGQVMAFGGGAFKGYAFDSEGLNPWYGYGLRLSFDYFSDEYHVEMGSSDSSLAIQVKRFDTVTAYPYRMGVPTGGPASDAQYFQGAFSEEYNSVRYVATDDGTKIKVYNFGTLVPDCTIDMPSGKYARAIYSGTQGFFYDGYVAYTLGTGTGVTGYGVARLNGSCSSAGGTPETVVNLFQGPMADAKITSILQVRTSAAPGTDSWKNDLFVTVGSLLYGQSVVRWHYDGSTWNEMANPFQDSASAIYQDNVGDVYTLEVEDLFNDVLHLRQYATDDAGSGHFKAGLYTDTDGTYLRPSSLGHWMIVMPQLP